MTTAAVGSLPDREVLAVIYREERESVITQHLLISDVN
jgi:hypothetical protein